MRNLGLWAAAWVLSLGSGCAIAPAGPMVGETIEETVELAADGRLALKNVNGRVEIDSWDREEVQIRAEKHAAGNDALSELKVVIESSPDSVQIRTELGDSPREWFRNQKKRVDYYLTVPVGASLDLSTVNGGVEIEEIHGSVIAKSVNGRIEAADLSGRSDLTTVNGSITLLVSEEGVLADGKLTTVNGRVHVRVPEGAGGAIRAKTVNGGIRTALPFTRDKESGWGPMKRVEGRFGDGGERLVVSTVNGGIRIERLDAEGS